MQSLATSVLRTPLTDDVSPADVTSTPPAHRAAPATPPPGIAPAAEPVLPPILVADDDSDDVYFIERLLKKTGVKNPIKTFNDGTEVVNYLGARLADPSRTHAPSLLFLDLKMAGLGGFGFLEWARQQKGLSPLTIVVLSNSSEPGDMARAIALGAHRYLIKYPCVQTMTTIVRSVYPFTLVK